MLSLASLLLLLALQAKAEQQCGTTLTDTRIVGGQAVGSLTYPWFALLRLRTAGDPPVCAGSLIAPTYVLTAAHCYGISPSTPNEELFTVALGVYNRCLPEEPSRQVFTTPHVHVHERYKSSGKFFDIALITLDRPAVTPPVCLPPPGRVTGPEPGLVVGFGVTRQGNRILPCRQRQAKVTRFSQQQCAETRLPAEDTQEPTVFCGGAKGIDSCQGDSGGPFLLQNSDGRYILSGIVSYGYGCAKDELPGVYTDVSSYLGWISDKMGQTPAKATKMRNRSPHVTGNVLHIREASAPQLSAGGVTRTNQRGHVDIFHREEGALTGAISPGGGGPGGVQVALSKLHPVDIFHFPEQIPRVTPNAGTGHQPNLPPDTPTSSSKGTMVSFPAN